MLGYFRINDPYRLVIIFILLLLFRLPYFISSEWLSIPELRWMLIGEKMNDGAILYADLWDDIGPLSALVYKGIDFVFGRSYLAIQILGLLLFYFQIFYINYIALKHKMYNENNYLPALLYGILGLLIFNITTLSPVLMGLTFILFSLNNLLTHIETRAKTDANLINIGLFAGIAMMFYLPFTIAVFIHILILLFFTNTLKRRYLLMIYGLLVPTAIIWLFYIWYGQASVFYTKFVLSLFEFHYESFLTTKTFLFVSGASIFLYILSTFKILTGFGFNIFQVRIQKTMFFASVVFLVIWLFFSERAGYGLVMFLPWVVFFLSHFFLSIRNRLKRELSFLIYFISILIFYSGSTFQIFGIDKIVEFSPVLVKTQQNENPIYSGKKILVLGSDIKPYFYGKVATPYFNWEMSKTQLEELSYYDNLEAIDKNIRGDMPDFIVDQIGLAPQIFEKIPLLGKEFIKTENGIYRRSSMASN